MGCRGLTDILKILHSDLLRFPPVKRDTLLSQMNQRVSDRRKITSKNPQHTPYTKESANLSKVQALGPVMDFLDLVFTRNMIFEGTFVPNHSCIQHSENKFFSGYHHTNILKALENPVNNLKVFPDDVTNTWIVRNGLIRAIQSLVWVVTDLTGRLSMNG